MFLSQILDLSYEPAGYEGACPGLREAEEELPRQKPAF